MTHELSRSKDLSHEVQRVLLEQMEAAESDLAGSRLSEASTHQARKALKKAGATLRLLRESILE